MSELSVYMCMHQACNRANRQYGCWASRTQHPADQPGRDARGSRRCGALYPSLQLYFYR